LGIRDLPLFPEEVPESSQEDQVLAIQSLEPVAGGD
jgi:hypothetical protein